MKIHSLDVLAEICRELRDNGCTIVHCHGCFDVIGAAHAKHLQQAKKMGDVLIVTVTPDHFVNKGDGRPVFRDWLRMEMLAALECVDYVGLNKWRTAVETIKKLKPHIYVKGSEYRHNMTAELYRECEALDEIKSRLAFTEGEEFHSTRIISACYADER